MRGVYDHVVAKDASRMCEREREGARKPPRAARIYPPKFHTARWPQQGREKEDFALSHLSIYKSIPLPLWDGKKKTRLVFALGPKKAFLDGANKNPSWVRKIWPVCVEGDVTDSPMRVTSSRPCTGTAYRQKTRNTQLTISRGHQG